MKMFYTRNVINRISNPLCKQDMPYVYIVKISVTNIVFADIEEQVESMIKSGKMEKR